MELPRIASQTSICPPSIQLLTDYSKPRTPVSKRLLSAANQQEPQFATLPSAASYQPSRRLEEARALQNLRRRLQAVRVLEANRELTDYDKTVRSNEDQEELDNKQHLLQKVSGNFIVSCYPYLLCTICFNFNFGFFFFLMSFLTT